MDSYQDWVVQLETTLECYNLATEEDGEPCNIIIPESEGTCEVQGPKLEIPEIKEKAKGKAIVGEKKEKQKQPDLEEK